MQGSYGISESGFMETEGRNIRDGTGKIRNNCDWI